MCHTLIHDDTVIHIAFWSVGLMDKASASGAGDSRFESWADQCTSQTWPAWSSVVVLHFASGVELHFEFLSGSLRSGPAVSAAP